MNLTTCVNGKPACRGCIAEDVCYLDDGPDHAAVPCPAPPTERVFIPRALRCACTDAHHRGSALCPLTPVDPWDPSLSQTATTQGTHMEQEIPRDRYGRPLITPPEGGEPVPYTRVSTLAKALDDLNNLMAWKQRKTAQGLLMRPDLMTRLSGALANGDPDSHYPTKRELNAICKEATEAAGSSTGASSGTGLHALTEALDRGNEPLFVSPADQARLDDYRAATDGYQVIDIETFVVNDELRAAGTFDRLLLCPDGAVRVADLKTGKSEADYPLATSMQIATYANGVRYYPEDGHRATLDDHLDLTTGLLIHLPATGGCQVIPLDLERGWRAAKLAAEIHHEVRKWKSTDLIRGGAA